MQVKLACVAMALSAAVFAPQALGPVAASQPMMAEAAGGFCDSLLSLLMKFFPDSVKRARIAAYPILNATGDKSVTAGAWVSEYLIRQLRTSGRFDVVDRKAYRRALRNRDLGPRDVVDDSTAKEMSVAFAAPYMLTGTIASAPSGKYLLEGRIVDAQTGIIVTGASIEVAGAEFDALENMLISQRMQSAITPAMLRSMVIPGWGQFYRKRSVPGALFLAGFWTTAGVDVYCFVEWVKAYLKDLEYREYLDYSDEYKRDLAEYARQQQKTVAEVENEFADLKSKKGDRLAEDALQKLALTGAVSAVAACIYAFNLIDVAVAGRRMAHEYRLYFTGDFVNEAGVTLSFDF